MYPTSASADIARTVKASATRDLTRRRQSTRRVAHQNRRCELRQTLGLEWRLPAYDLVEHGAITEDVASTIERLRSQLFWRHVRRSSHDYSGVRQQHRRLGFSFDYGMAADHFRQAKVEYLHFSARRNHDV